MASDKVRIHGKEWERSYIRASADEARKKRWMATECLVPPEQHKHCVVCWWELYASDDAERGTAYAANDEWLCRECYERFIVADELGLAAV